MTRENGELMNHGLVIVDRPIHPTCLQPSTISYRLHRAYCPCASRLSGELLPARLPPLALPLLIHHGDLETQLDYTCR